MFFFYCDSPDVLSMATALGDFVAPDCRFTNIKRGQRVYVYSKLLPVDGAGVFWSESVCAKSLKTLTHFSTQPVPQQYWFHIASAHAFMHEPLFHAAFTIGTMSASKSAVIHQLSKRVIKPSRHTHTHFLPCCILYFLLLTG